MISKDLSFMKGMVNMLTFGKKISFRPLLISLIFFFLFGFLFWGVISSLFGDKFIFLGWLIGAAMFLLVAGLYYPNVIKYEFNYFEITDKQINYYDLSSWWKRFKLVLFGRNIAMKSIDLKAIKSASLIGQKDFQKMPPSLTFPLYLTFSSGINAMIQNPCKLELKLSNGEKLSLLMNRDMVYDPGQTVKKGKQAVKMIQNSTNA